LSKVKILTVIIAASLVFLAACTPDKPKPKLPVGDKAEDIPNFVMEGFKLRSTEQGDVQWELEAKGAQIFEMKKKAYAQDFTMRSFEKGKITSTLTGDRAVIDTVTNFLEATGNVHLKANNGMLLITEKFFWDDQKKLAYGDAAVTVIKGNTTLKGVGFESDMDMRNLQIKKRVRLKAEDIGNE
jgi:LPS export ABC transporter protein LptC